MQDKVDELQFEIMKILIVEELPMNYGEELAHMENKKGPENHTHIEPKGVTSLQCLSVPLTTLKLINLASVLKRAFDNTEAT